MEDKVVAGAVVEVLGAYHVAGHNSDRLSHPDSPTEAGPIYPPASPLCRTSNLKSQMCNREYGMKSNFGSCRQKSAFEF